MRTIAVCASAVLLCLCLAACQREIQIDPVLFCADFNRRSRTFQLREEDAFLRENGEVALFCDAGVICLQVNENGAVHTAVVTADTPDSCSALASDAFAVLAQPLSEDVPQAFFSLLQTADRSVRMTQTKRFQYFVFESEGAVTALQLNRLLSGIPVRPTLRP